MTHEVLIHSPKDRTLLPNECPQDIGMLTSFVVDGCEEMVNLDVTPLDLFMCAANMKEPLDRLTNDWVGPWCFADVVSSVAQETELLEETVSRDLCPVKWWAGGIESLCSTIISICNTSNHLASCLQGFSQMCTSFIP